ERLGDEALDDAGHRPAIGFGAGRDVAHQLGIKAARLAAGGLETAFRREIGMDGDELLLEGDGTDDVEEKGLAGTVFADHEAVTGAAVADALDILQKGADL